ncbi:thioesterase [Shewanella sp. JM162201]|uniref:Thioesterase n=1 Tax=Shewanella jiangmenensis TaxID=2837387 RepID=A0ABS5V0J7_9GAMM|nr:thioesterase family protein [Shewanella jiangmenensis]MBT1443405.1 thioesterase [Shewanella jiangmenensis]
MPQPESYPEFATATEHRFSVQIYYEDTDFSGVVYHANFIKYFERAREHVIGAGVLRQLWQEQGIGFAVYRCDMICNEGVEFADVVEVRSKVVIESKYRTLWQQEIWRQGSNRAAVTGYVEMVSLNSARQLTPMPQSLISLLKAN